VDQVDVEVGCAELFQGKVEVGFDVFWPVGGIPELGDEGDIFAREISGFDPVGDL